MLVLLTMKCCMHSLWECCVPTSINGCLIMKCIRCSADSNIVYNLHILHIFWWFFSHRACWAGGRFLAWCKSLHDVFRLPAAPLVQHAIAHRLRQKDCIANTDWDRDTTDTKAAVSSFHFSVPFKEQKNRNWIRFTTDTDGAWWTPLTIMMSVGFPSQYPSF